MKKGIYVFGLLVFLVIYCNQDVLANVTLNVNATNSTAANKIYYRATSTATVPTTVTLPWKEKAVYSGTTGGYSINVYNKVAGDLIIKVDFLSATTGGALSVSSKWLKSKSSGDAEMVANHVTPTVGVAIDKDHLNTLCLKTTTLTARTTTALFTHSDPLTLWLPTYIIFTAVLVDSASAEHPQVLGVDIQTIFFNYIDTTTNNLDWYNDPPIWLTFIQAAP